MHFTFDEAMIIHALEMNGWRNVWDIYWINDSTPGWGGLTTEDAFFALLREKNLLPATPAQPNDQLLRR